MKTAGYSGTPLAKKLGIVEGSSVLLAGAPKDFTLDDLPALARVSRRAKRDVDVALVFVTERTRIAAAFEAVAPSMTKAGGIWLVWPKKASKIPTDVTEDVLREEILPTGWVDNKVCAVDERYSGLRFVLRKELR